MATTRKTTTAAPVESTVESNAVEKEVKKFSKDDLIACKSITSGELYVDGPKTGTLYKWAAYGEIEYLEYQDLNYLVRGKHSSVMIPRFIIEDEDFIAENPILNDLYSSIYSVRDLREVLKLPAKQMASTIESLPKGAKDAIKGIASTMIENHQLDSVAKIKEIDSIFGTQLLVTLVQE